MRINLKSLLFITCLFGLALIAVRLFDPVPTPSASTALERPIHDVPAIVAESSMKTSPRWRLPKLSSQTQPAPDPMISAAVEPPQDPDELREWARQNPEEALIWLRSAAAGEARDTVVEIACARTAESNPAEAVSLAERFSGGCSNLLENLVYQWADLDEPAARAYAMSKPAGAERDRLLSRVAFSGAKENPAESAKLVAEWISPGDVQNEAAISVLHQWALRDPDAALAWAQQFSEDSLRARALNEMAHISPPSQE